MSEHTPLTEAEWLDLGVVAAQAIRDNLPLDAFGDPKRLRDYSDIWGAAAKNAIRRHLAARTSTATAEPCEACDDCTALVIGPNTDGDPCPWCQTCGCHYLAHAASTATADTARLRDLTRRLGFGDDITEPMADNDTIVAWFEEQSRDANEWQESQRWRDDCYAKGHPDDEDCWECDPSLRLIRAEEAATADDGLRERVEALAEVREGLTKGMHSHHDGEHWVRLGYVLDLLDRAATPASTEDRADNEGTR